MKSTREHFTRWTGQLMHIICLKILFLLLLVLGVDTILAFLAFLSALWHQGLVVVVWRRVLFSPVDEDDRRKKIVWVFGIFFFLLFSSRLIITVIAAAASSGSLGWSLGSRIAMAIPIIFLGSWTLYSVFRYFGVYRALGADHFDPRYRELPFERRGIYRFTSNGMYSFATLFFLLPGLLYNAYEGLLIGLFHYAAVWVHYHATEKPDLRFMHGDQDE